MWSWAQYLIPVSDDTDAEASAESNARAMTSAAESVSTGEVTRAVRNTNTDAGPVSEGDWIGLVRGDGVVAVSGTVVGASTALLDQLVTDDRELLTVVTGAEAASADTDAIVGWLTQNRPDVAVEIHRGGQPLYPYLFGVE